MTIWLHAGRHNVIFKAALIILNHKEVLRAHLERADDGACRQRDV